MRWAAPGGLRSLVAALATGLDIRLQHEVRHVGPGPCVDGEPAHAVVLAMPDPQAARLLDPVPAELVDRRWNPVIAVAAGWAERTWAPFPAAFVNGHPVLALVADDGDRRGDGAPVLVAHSTADVARAHDADPDGAVPEVLAALRALLGVGDPQWTYAHRWRFAAPAAQRDATHWFGDGIGLACDAWGRSRVEAAWRSGTDLARAIVADPSGESRISPRRPEIADSVCRKRRLAAPKSPTRGVETYDSARGEVRDLPGTAPRATVIP
jgi:predicted NAD/FAD-dependent oxidoreductase